MPFRAGLVRPRRAPGSDLTSPTGISAGGRLAGGSDRRTAPRPHTPRTALKLPSATRAWFLCLQASVWAETITG